MQPAAGGGFEGDGRAPTSSRRTCESSTLPAISIAEESTRLGVGMRGTREDLLDRPDFDHLAEIHDGDPVGQLPYHPEVVGDEEHRERLAFLECAQQLEHLGLDRDVQRRDDLVADQELRLGHEGACDADPLALAAGEFLRTAVEHLDSQSDIRESLCEPGRDVRIGAAWCGFEQDLAHGQAWVQ